MPKLSNAAKELLLKHQNFKCWYCGDPIDLTFCQIDHIVALSCGGSNRKNMVACCAECNAFKGTMTLKEFRKRVTREFYFVKRKLKPLDIFEMRGLLGAIAIKAKIERSMVVSSV